MPEQSIYNFSVNSKSNSGLEFVVGVRIIKVLVKKGEKYCFFILRAIIVRFAKIDTSCYTSGRNEY